MAEKNEELETRVRLFNNELQALQKKYMLLLVAKIVHPSQNGQPSAVTHVPLTVEPIIEQKSELTDPTK